MPANDTVCSFAVYVVYSKLRLARLRFKESLYFSVIFSGVWDDAGTCECGLILYFVGVISKYAGHPRDDA